MERIELDNLHQAARGPRLHANVRVVGVEAMEPLFVEPEVPDGPRTQDEDAAVDDVDLDDPTPVVIRAVEGIRLTAVDLP
jgi:hypothetical protein